MVLFAVNSQYDEVENVGYEVAALAATAKLLINVMSTNATDINFFVTFFFVLHGPQADLLSAS